MPTDTDPWASMQRRIKALEEEVGRRRDPPTFGEPVPDLLQAAVYRGVTESRNWDDVLHGMHLARDIVQREIDLLKQGKGILLGVDDLIASVESGNRIEYDETRSWRWVSGEDHRTPQPDPECKKCMGTGWHAGDDHMRNDRCRCNP